VYGAYKKDSFVFWMASGPKYEYMQEGDKLLKSYATVSLGLFNKSRLFCLVFKNYPLMSVTVNVDMCPPH
jgi:hypothetical protein